MTYLGLFPTSVIKPMNKLHTMISRYRHLVFKENNRTVVILCVTAFSDTVRGLIMERARHLQ